MPPLREFKRLLREEPDSLRTLLQELVQAEAVVHLEDVMLRRTDWGMDPSEGAEVAEAVEGLLGWRGADVADRRVSLE